MAVRMYFVIYDHPSDFPDDFVVRTWMVLRDGATMSLSAKPTDTLDEARALIPRVCVRIGRSPEDDPVIVETWI